MLWVLDISKRFGAIDALRRVSFEVRENEILGLIGPNGSGKTTLMETVSGLLPCDSGTVSWQGEPLREHRKREKIFYLPDGVLPYEDAPVSQTLDFFARSFQTPQEQIALAIERLELRSVMGKRAGQLSKGFRKRVCLAIALFAPQAVLFLDEPFDGFDLKQGLRVMDLLRQVKKAGKTLFLSIHQLSDAQKICERLVLLSDGKIVGSGTLPELQRQAKSPSKNLEEVFLDLT